VTDPNPRLRRFFRIVLSDPPTAWDFMSNMARGFPPPSEDVEIVRLWTGISVYDQRRYARKVALRAPRLGAFVAELSIPDDAAIRSERMTKSHGHYTLWGDLAAILACVVDVRPASEWWEIDTGVER
jgi:hypothetical protein